MDTRLTATHGIWRLLVTGIVALPLVMTLGAAPVSAAAPDCRVQNTDTGKTYQALQAAVDAARDGDRLTVRGTCVGATVIDSRLVIQGISTKRSGRAILDADGQGRAVRIKPAARVTIRDLTDPGRECVWGDARELRHRGGEAPESSTGARSDSGTSSSVATSAAPMVRASTTQVCCGSEAPVGSPATALSGRYSRGLFHPAGSGTRAPPP